MNKDRLAGKWQQLRGEAQKEWGKLTDNQLDQIEGDRTKLAGVIRETYGIAREEAEEQVREFYNRFETRKTAA